MQLQRSCRSPAGTGDFSASLEPFDVFVLWLARGVILVLLRRRIPSVIVARRLAHGIQILPDAFFWSFAHAAIATRDRSPYTCRPRLELCLV